MVVVGLGVTGAGVALDARHPRPVGARGRRARPGLRHLALVLQAGARRAALPRLRPGRRGPRERRRARHPHGGHRPAPHPRDADADAADDAVGHAQAGADPGRPARRRPAPPRRRHPLRHPAAPAPGLRHRGAGDGPRRCARPGSAAACSAGTASSRTTPGWSPRWRARRRRTAPTSAPAPGCSRPPGPRSAPRRADRRDRSRSPPARSSTPPASGPATSSTRSGCGPAAAPTWCCAPRRCPGCAPRSIAPVPGQTNRFVLVLPQPDGTVYVGLTDEPVEGPVPDVPEPTEPEIGFLLDVCRAAFEPAAAPLRRGRRLRRAAAAARRPAPASTADLSRRHAVLIGRTRRGDDRRRQADDLPADGRGRRRRRRRARRHRRRRCRTRSLPLLGAADRRRPGRAGAPPRLVRRFGTEPALVLDNARRSPA